MNLRVVATSTLEGPLNSRGRALGGERIGRRNKAVALVCLVCVSVLSASCDDSSSIDAPTVEVTQRVTPQVTATASPMPTPFDPQTPVRSRRTGVPELDLIIVAVEMRDYAHIESKLRFGEQACVSPQQEGTPPGCETAEPVGTLVPSFPVTGCATNYARNADEVMRELESRLDYLRPSVYAVFKLPTSSPSHQMAFSYRNEESRGIVFDVESGQILSIAYTCTKDLDELVLDGAETLIERP